jgi:hypothetical protein
LQPRDIGVPLFKKAVLSAHLNWGASAANLLSGLARARPEVLEHRTLERELFFFIEAGDHAQSIQLSFHMTARCSGDFSDEIEVKRNSSAMQSTTMANVWSYGDCVKPPTRALPPKKLSHAAAPGRS